MTIIEALTKQRSLVALYIQHILTTYGKKLNLHKEFVLHR